MSLPKQSPPVKRPELIQPHDAVDVEHGSADDLVRIRMKLIHGANFNDPPWFRAASAFSPGAGDCGCGCDGTGGCSRHRHD